MVQPDDTGVQKDEHVRNVQGDMTPEQLHEFEREWSRDEEGLPHRTAARVVLLDTHGDTYMLAGHDFDDANHHWWFTIGGGVQPGEDYRNGAVRELCEETGLCVDPERLIGPVLFRQAKFYFTTHTRRQDEYFYILKVTEHEREIVESGQNTEFTPMEQRVIDGGRWFTVDSLVEYETQGEAMYPVGFADMVRGWLRGWDGVMLHVVEE